MIMKKTTTVISATIQENHGPLVLEICYTNVTCILNFVYKTILVDPVLAKPWKVIVNDCLQRLFTLQLLIKVLI